MLAKDRAHAAQRLLSRPWKADPFLKDIILQLVEKQHSVARLIVNSQQIKELYNDFRSKSKEPVKISKAVKDLAWAPQRYSSEAKVLARLVLTWDSVLGVLTAVPTIRGPRSPEGQACLETLRFLDPEKVLQLGMLADSALELHRVVRSFDADDFDEAELPQELDLYRSILERLFIDGLCLQVPGMTKLMMGYLEKPRNLLVADVAKTLGGTDPQTNKQCLIRMSAYVAVAKSVMEGEFPSFELMSSLRAFSVSDEIKSTQRRQSGEIQNCLEKLAQAIGVCAATLQYEYDRLYPLAAKFGKQGLRTFEAWKKAVGSASKSMASYTTEALVPVLARLGAWSCSSSSVERGFGMALAAKQLGQGQDEHVVSEESILIIQQDILRGKAADELDLKDNIMRAKAIWASCCSRVRKSGDGKRKARWDKGLPRTAVCVKIAILFGDC